MGDQNHADHKGGNNDKFSYGTSKNFCLSKNTIKKVKR